MANDTQFPSLFAGLGSGDGPGALTALVEEHGHLLLGMPGLAEALVSDGEMDEELRLDLFHMLVDEARMDMENRGRLGRRFLAEAADAVSALSGAGSLDPETGMSLVLAYARAGVEAPEGLVASVQENTLAEIGSDGLPDDLDTQIEDFRREVGDDDYMLYAFLNDLLGGMLVPLQVAFVQHVAGRDEAWSGSLALYWLLSPVPEVRLAAADGLGEQARRGRLDTAAVSKLTLMRTWVPADGVLPVLDTALREARGPDPVEGLEMPSMRPVRLLGTLPDGSGSQSFAVSLDSADGSAAAFVLLKAGHGVKDAFLMREMAAADAMLSQLAELSEASSVDLAIDALEPALSAALADGLAEGKTAPPILIDVARACGLEALRPQVLTARDWFSRIDPEGEVVRLPAGKRAELIERSGDWPLDYSLIANWSEGTAIVEGALEGINGSRPQHAALWTALERRRDYWAQLMVRSAHVLRSATGDRDWRSFVATATALIDGEALEGIPIMQHVLDTSVAAWQEEERALDANDPAEGGWPFYA